MSKSIQSITISSSTSATSAESVKKPAGDDNAESFFSLLVTPDTGIPKEKVSQYLPDSEKRRPLQQPMPQEMITLEKEGTKEEAKSTKHRLAASGQMLQLPMLVTGMLPDQPQDISGKRSLDNPTPVAGGKPTRQPGLFTEVPQNDIIAAALNPKQNKSQLENGRLAILPEKRIITPNQLAGAEDQLQVGRKLLQKKIAVPNLAPDVRVDTVKTSTYGKGQFDKGERLLQQTTIMLRTPAVGQATTTEELNNTLSQVEADKHPSSPVAELASILKTNQTSITGKANDAAHQSEGAKQPSLLSHPMPGITKQMKTDSLRNSEHQTSLLAAGMESSLKPKVSAAVLQESQNINTQRSNSSNYTFTNAGVLTAQQAQTTGAKKVEDAAVTAKSTGPKSLLQESAQASLQKAMVEHPQESAQASLQKAMVEHPQESAHASLQKAMGAHLSQILTREAGSNALKGVISPNSSIVFENNDFKQSNFDVRQQIMDTAGLTPWSHSDLSHLLLAGMSTDTTLTPMSARVEVPVGQKGWGQAVGEQVVWFVSQNVKTANLRLHPQHLGPLELRIHLDGDQTNVTFVSQHSSVRDALESSIPRLREMFADSGMSLANVNVSQQGFSNQRDQGLGGFQGGTGSSFLAPEEAPQAEPESDLQHAADAASGLVDYYV